MRAHRGEGQVKKHLSDHTTADAARINHFADELLAA
jgi:hypothetical protein